MRRFRISRLMILIVLLAINCAVVRMAVGDMRAPSGGRELRGLTFLGLLPLGNAVVAALAVLVRRFRVVMRRRPRSRKPPLLARFAGWGGAVLLGAMALGWASPYSLLAHVELMAGATIRLADELGWAPATGSIFDYLVVSVVFAALSVSGPLLVLTALLATIPYQVEVALIPRTMLAPRTGPSSEPAS